LFEKGELKIMAGWQDAVAGLQAQINTINSQISSLSGQEATNSAAISSLQTQVAALQVQLLALQSQVVLADLPAVAISPLGSLLEGTQKTVQLVAGGDAVLHVPVQDGLSFKLKITGHTHDTSNTGVNLQVVLFANGTQTSANVAQGGNSTSPDHPFHIEEKVFWDSTSNTLVLYGDAVHGSPASTVINSVQDTIPLSSPTDFSFKVNGYLMGGTEPNATLTITEFRAYAD
jgi:hypothetical protein